MSGEVLRLWDCPLNPWQLICALQFISNRCAYLDRLLISADTRSSSSCLPVALGPSIVPEIKIDCIETTLFLKKKNYSTFRKTMLLVLRSISIFSWLTLRSVARVSITTNLLLITYFGCSQQRCDQKRRDHTQGCRAAHNSSMSSLTVDLAMLLRRKYHRFYTSLTSRCNQLSIN